MLVGYELPSVAPEEVGLSVEKLQSVPEAMQKLVDEKRIAAGGGHSLALRSDGSIVGWGDNEYGQATLPAGNDFVAIATGWDYSLAIRRGPCQYALAGDLSDDCRVDFADLAIMAANWLIDCVSHRKTSSALSLKHLRKLAICS